MSMQPFNPSTMQRNKPSLRALALALLVVAPGAYALSTDREKPMDITADHAKMIQGTDKAAGVTYLTGNVRIIRGSMKASSADATIYQHPANAKDAQGKDVSSAVQRVILVGKPAHMEEIGKNGDLVTSSADKIDYNADTAIAELTGNVTVVQQGRSEFHGTHMTYDTNTGEMESGDNTAANRVHMIIQPKAVKAKPADPKAAEKPVDAAPKNDQPSAKAVDADSKS
ncbi:MAG: lipopolysaccharide transport periplasmic protein LptA [Dokdonella sp.]